MRKVRKREKEKNEESRFGTFDIIDPGIDAGLGIWGILVAYSFNMYLTCLFLWLLRGFRGCAYRIISCDSTGVHF